MSVSNMAPSFVVLVHFEDVFPERITIVQILGELVFGVPSCFHAALLPLCGVDHQQRHNCCHLVVDWQVRPLAEPKLSPWQPHDEVCSRNPLDLIDLSLILPPGKTRLLGGGLYN